MAAVNKRILLKRIVITYLIKKRADRRERQCQQLAVAAKKSRRWWVRPHIKERRKHGHYHQLMQTLRDSDRESFFR